MSAGAMAVTVECGPASVHFGHLGMPTNLHETERVFGLAGLQVCSPGRPFGSGVGRGAVHLNYTRVGACPDRCCVAFRCSVCSVVWREPRIGAVLQPTPPGQLAADLVDLAPELERPGKLEPVPELETDGIDPRVAELEAEPISRATLEKLPEYSASFPTGVTIGKVWRRNLNAGRRAPPLWIVGEYVRDGVEGAIVQWRRAEIIP